MTAQTKIKDQNFTLPKKWVGKDVIIKESDDAIIIKMVEKSEFWETWKKIRSFSKDFNKKDIDNAIRWAQKS